MDHRLQALVSKFRPHLRESAEIERLSSETMIMRLVEFEFESNL